MKTKKTESMQSIEIKFAHSYIQDIQTLNADLNIVRNIGESDEEFAQRLAGLSQELTSPGEEDEAIKRKFFKNEIKLR